MTERWKPIPGYEGYYEASSLGRVRSLARRVWVSPSRKAPMGCYRPVKERFLKPTADERGYLLVVLWKDHEPRYASIHILVLETFVGPRPEDRKYGCHRDDDPRNNRLDNLYWGTPTQNSADKISNGNQAYGENCSSAKLTDAQVAEIRRLSGAMPQSKIGELFGVCQAQVSRITNYRQRTVL